jgi:hypothetical protein
LSGPESIAEIGALLSHAEGARRTDLARRLCERFGFLDSRGRAQTAGCLKALGELSRAGHFALPAARSRPARGAPRRLGAPVPAPRGVPGTAGAVRERDAWLGWDAPSRRARLHRVVSMSRFLLRPRGCRNLASRVLGGVLNRLAADFETAYGYRPYLVESFVDTARFDGGCYRTPRSRS